MRDRTAAPQQANEEIRQLAVTDAMTGLTDRRGFYLLAEQKLRGAHHNGPIGLPPAIGVVQAPAHGAGATVDELLTRADELMYDENKTSGNTRA